MLKTLLQKKLRSSLLIKATEPLCPSVHLAVEMYCLNQNYDFPIGFLRTNKKSVVIGNNQLAKAECNLSNMEKDNITLIKRQSGGGAVYLDEGNCMFGLINKGNFDKVKENYQNILINAIDDTFGINSKIKGKNDIVVDNKKVAGLAFKKNGDNNLCHACILVDCELDKLQKYLTPNKIKLLSHHVQSIDKRVVNLNHFNNSKSREDLEFEIEKEFTFQNGEFIFINEKVILENNDIYKISNEIKEFSKKAKEEPIPNYKYVMRDKFNWGFCEIYVSVDNNAIKDIVILTDTVDTELVDNIKKLMINKTLFELFSIKNTDYEDNIADVISLLKSVLLDH
jgi:lipoate-protein ligase A